MAQIVTITNPLTGQPTQVDQLEHTAQQIDDAVAASTVESTDYPGCYYRTVSGVTEWVNPPMLVGVEYRTTERYLGKPVYAKLVAFGALPNATTKTVAHGVKNLSIPFSTEGHITSGSRTAIGAVNPTWSVTSSNIIATTSTDMSARSANIKIKYTKTTD